MMTTGISILATYRQRIIRMYQSQSLWQHAVVLCLGVILARLPLCRHVVSVLALLSTTPRLVVLVARTLLCLELHHLTDHLPAFPPAVVVTASLFLFLFPLSLAVLAALFLRRYKFGFSIT